MCLPYLNKTPWSFLKRASPVIVSLALAITCIMVATSWRTRIMPAGTVIVPFTLETEEYAYQRDPQGELAERRLTARRSDGTTATIATLFPGTAREHAIRTINYPHRRSVHLVDAIAAKTTWPLRPTRIRTGTGERLRHAPQDCVFADHQILLGKGTVLGHEVNIVSRSFTSTAWMAPDLGCQVIQSRNGYKHDGAFKLISETRAVSLTMGEPDPGLFDQGLDYADLKPSALLRQDTLRLGIPWNDRLQEQAESAEEAYLAAH